MVDSDLIAIIRGLSWAASKANYNNTSDLGIKCLNIYKIYFEKTPPSILNPVKFTQRGNEMFGLINERNNNYFIITPELPFVVYQYDNGYIGMETNCSQEVIDRLISKNQIREHKEL